MSFKGSNPPAGSNPGSPSRSRRSSYGDPKAFTGINNSAARAEAALAFVRRPRTLSNANGAAAFAANKSDFLNSINTQPTRENNQANLRALAKKYNGTRRRGGPLAKNLEAQRLAQAKMLKNLWNMAGRRTTP